MAKRPYNRNISGVRGKVPSGAIAMRVSKGEGRLELTDRQELVSALGVDYAQRQAQIEAMAATTTEQLTGTETGKFSTPDSVAALWEKGADIASAGTITIGEGGYHHVTGTTTITDIDWATDKAGRWAWLVFDGALVLTHNATTLILPTGANITTAAGDSCLVVSEGSDAVRVVVYQRKDGTALTSSGGGGGSSFVGAQVYLTGALSGPTAETAINWHAVDFDTKYDPGDGGLEQRFWLGVDFTFATTDVNTTDDQITETSHGMVTGEGPVWFSSSTTLPAGISASTNYWIIRVDDNTFKVATSRALAIAGTAVDITSQGTGTHTCLRADSFCIPSGVTRVRFVFGATATDITGNISMRIGKNGTGLSEVGANFVSLRTDNTTETSAHPSGLVAVAGGNRMQLMAAADDTFNFQAPTYCAMEVMII